MQTIIIEGLDRCGKDTIIQHIISKSNNVVLRHCSFPKGNTIEEKIQYQKDSFEYELSQCKRYIENEKYDMDNSFYIFNRSHLGECVYGPMYRNSEADWVYDLEKKYLDPANAYLIMLYGDPEFLIKNDDGLSFSTDVEKKSEEIWRFKRAFEKSSIEKKLLLKINDKENYINLSYELELIDNFLKI